jgi:Domain of unknown function (DUF4129)
LLDSVAKSELGKRDVSHEHDVVVQIRKEIPETEKIEWPGGSVETANQWLTHELELFQNEPDSTKRAVIMTGVNERLAAIGKKIDEIKNPAISGRTKDEDKQKLAEILRREEYQKPQANEESLFQRWMREFLEWLKGVFPKPSPMPATDADFASLKFVLQIVIYALVLGLVGFLIYRFAPFLAGRFGRGVKQKKTDRVILGERIGADESGSDLFDEAERLAREGNLRSAIRKGYIALLCELSDRKVIGLARHKTNRDYLRDVRKRTDLFENMNGMTSNFERNWYGLRPADLQDWEDFRDRYKQTIAIV